MSDTEVDLFPHQSTSTTGGGGSGSSSHLISHNRPHTPPHNNLNAAAPGELSPPRSQSHSVVNDNNANNGIPFGGANGLQQHQHAYQQDSYIDDNDIGGLDGAEAVGGAGGAGAVVGPGDWKSKKARDDMARAWEFVADKDWSAREFGDVVLLARKDGSTASGGAV